MLQRPVLTPLVVGFWLVTSGWLVVAKILPALNPGSPPGQQALYAAGNRLIPVAWTVQWNDRPVGWALATSERTPESGLVVDSQLHFEHLPIEELLPVWAGLLVRRVAHRNATATIDALGRLEIDASGQLRAFNSRVNLPGADPVRLHGTVDDGTVAITIEAGGMKYETTRHLPSHVMIGDELSPQATLPGLYEGRRWTVPVYSPLRPGQAPIEILHAEVGPAESLFWETTLIRVHPVAFRDDPTSDRDPRCRLWVDLAGRVLKQEAALLGAKMSFLRRSDAAAAALAAAPPEWRARGTPASVASSRESTEP